MHCVLGLLLITPWMAGDAKPMGTVATDPFQKQVLPVLEQYCIDCHSGDEPSAGLALDLFTSHDEAIKAGRTWAKVYDAIESKTMPPEDAEPLPAKDYAKVMNWIQKDVSYFNCTAERNPGRVTMRRLNKAEYNNTIRDLFGVGLRPADGFPADDVGHGFDNIGELLSMPPLLMEKYLEAAQLVSGRVVVTHEPQFSPVRPFKLKDFEGGNYNSPTSRGLYANGVMTHSLAINEDGEYLLRFGAWGNQAGKDPVRIEIRLDGKPVTAFDVEAVDGVPDEYRVPLQLKKGKYKLGVAFLNDHYDPQAPNPRQRDRNFYLSSAEVVGPMMRVVPNTLEVGSLQGGDRLSKQFDTRVMRKKGQKVVASIKVPETGYYLVRTRLAAQNVGGEPAKVDLRYANKVIDTVSVKADRSKFETSQAVLRLPAGESVIGWELANPYSDPKIADWNKKQRKAYIEGFEVIGPVFTADKDLPASHLKLTKDQPASRDAKEWRASAEKVLRPLLRKAYRRPIRQEDLDRLLELVEFGREQGETYDRTMQYAVQAVLVSPSFLFMVEGDTDDANHSTEISEHELAVRLSYFLWSSMPDAELSELADHGKLRSQLSQQVRRMLADPKAKSLVENFAGQWLQLRSLKAITPDKKVFPQFDESLRADMKKESEMFFTEVVQGDRDVLEFIDSDYTFVNDRLAKHYGLGGVKGSEFRRVALPKDSPLGGVLTQASVLTLTSNPNRTSPVKRGKWIMEQILGTPPPPPPPAVPELSEAKEAVEAATLRDRLAMHRAKPECSSCHNKMDPLGLAFENFDAIGQWRTKEGKFKIDASGTLPDGRSFDGPGSLKSILKEQPKRYFRCLSEKMLTYALGRGLEYYDRCTVDGVAEELASGDHRFSTLVLAVVHSDAFQRRGSEGSKGE